jgi:hypothetical protein
MSKNERTHGDHMATMGELNALYTTVIDLQKRIKILEAIRQIDTNDEFLKKERE